MKPSRGLFVEPTLDGDIKLYHLLTPYWFTSMVNKSEISLRQALKFKDTTELALNCMADDYQRVLSAASGSDKPGIGDTAFCVYAHCWSKQGDSARLWEGYGDGQGVQIQTTVDRLRAAVVVDEGLIATVRYYDTLGDVVGSTYNESAKWSGGGYNQLLCGALLKTREYEYEDEVRLAVWMDAPVRSQRALRLEWSAISFDLSTLIESIRVHPSLPDSDFQTLVRLCSDHCLPVPLRATILDVPGHGD